MERFILQLQDEHRTYFLTKFNLEKRLYEFNGARLFAKKYYEEEAAKIVKQLLIIVGNHYRMKRKPFPINFAITYIPNRRYKYEKQ